MTRIIPLVKTIQIDQDDFVSDFKKTKLVWNSFDEPLINIQANNVKIANLSMHVKSNNKSPAITIGNATKMVTDISFNDMSISCMSDVVHIMNAKNVTFTKCIFKTQDIRTNVFTLTDVYNVRFENCIFDGGNICFQLNSNTTGNVSKNKISNCDFLFDFSSETKSKWKVTDNSFYNINHMISGKSDSDHFITSNNRFHSSNSSGFLNNLVQYNEEETSRDLFGTIFGGGSTPSAPSAPSGGFAFFGKSFSITQILIAVAVGFVLLIIIVLVIVFAIKLAKGV